MVAGRQLRTGSLCPLPLLGSKQGQINCPNERGVGLFGMRCEGKREIVTHVRPERGGTRFRGQKVIVQEVHAGRP